MLIMYLQVKCNVQISRLNTRYFNALLFSEIQSLCLLRVFDLDLLQVRSLVILLSMSMEIGTFLLDVVKVLASFFESFGKLYLKSALLFQLDRTWLTSSPKIAPISSRV